MPRNKWYPFKSDFERWVAEAICGEIDVEHDRYLYALTMTQYKDIVPQQFSVVLVPLFRVLFSTFEFEVRRRLNAGHPPITPSAMDIYFRRLLNQRREKLNSFSEIVKGVTFFSRARANDNFQLPKK